MSGLRQVKRLWLAHAACMLRHWCYGMTDVTTMAVQ